MFKMVLILVAYVHLNTSSPPPKKIAKSNLKSWTFLQKNIFEKTTNPHVVLKGFSIWVFPRIGVGPENGWFIRENPNKELMIWGAHPYFWKHPTLSPQPRIKFKLPHRLVYETHNYIELLHPVFLRKRDRKRGCSKNAQVFGGDFSCWGVG